MISVVVIELSGASEDDKYVVSIYVMHGRHTTYIRKVEVSNVLILIMTVLERTR